MWETQQVTGQLTRPNVYSLEHGAPSHFRGVETEVKGGEGLAQDHTVSPGEAGAGPLGTSLGTSLGLLVGGGGHLQGPCRDLWAGLVCLPLHIYHTGGGGGHRGTTLDQGHYCWSLVIKMQSHLTCPRNCDCATRPQGKPLCYILEDRAPCCCTSLRDR